MEKSMKLFFYQDYEDLLKFANQRGFDEALPDSDSGEIADLSKEHITNFLSAKGYAVQDMKEAIKYSGSRSGESHE